MNNFIDYLINSPVIRGLIIFGLPVAWFSLKHWLSGNTENRLDRLALLSIDTTKTNNKTVIASEIIERCIKAMQTVRTYSGRIFIRDFTAKYLEKKQYIKCEWRIDFSAPNAIHVSQKIMDTELGCLYDKWITINEDHYQNAGWWYCRKLLDADESYFRLHEILKVGNLLGILKDEKPINVIECRYKGVTYIQLTYSLNKTNPHISEYLFNFNCTSIPVHLWINQKTHMLDKGCYILDGKAADGSIVKGDIQHIYTNYNAPFDVKPPPWLNEVTNENRENIIVNTKIPVVRHY